MSNLDKGFLEYLDTDYILESINKIDVLITDEKGNIIQTQSNFEEIYGCKSEDVIGCSVFKLEEDGIFRPSAVSRAIKTGMEVRLIQTIQNNKNFIVIAIPIKDRKDNIIKVIAYSIDIDEYFNIKKWSDELHKKIDCYNMKINELNKNKINTSKVINNKVSDFSYKEEVMKDMLTRNKLFENILNNSKKFAKYNVNILLLGETGVGKTMLAKKIHMLSDYNKGEFVEVNCSAIPDSLIESELFGYTKGSFTGARNEGKKGLIEIAENGTIFLDEISELPIKTQAKLLKVLEDKNVRRIGSVNSKKIDFRIIAATNKDLEIEVQKGNFRLDLLYRLNTIAINIPSLRDRKEDIHYLSEYFMEKYNHKYNESKILSNKVINLFTKYNWPGNIRELENVIQKLILTSDEELIDEKQLSQLKINKKNTDNIKISNVETILDLNKAIEEFEGEIIRTYFEKYNSSIKLAKVLKISQSTAARKIKKYVKV